MKCSVCEQEVAIVRELPAGKVCMGCNPFRRCPACLGLLQHTPEPNDMGLMTCDRCGKRTRTSPI